MSHGLGSMQRLMLGQLATWEVVKAEEAAEQQEPYLPPAEYALWQIVRALDLWDVPVRTGRFTHSIDYYYNAKRFNPSRALRTLCARGLVHRWRHIRVDNITLTRIGFAEALRLGLVGPSESVDYDRLMERWSGPADLLAREGEGVETFRHLENVLSRINTTVLSGGHKARPTLQTIVCNRGGVCNP